jgi:hypothetical protein
VPLKKDQNLPKMKAFQFKCAEFVVQLVLSMALVACSGGTSDSVTESLEETFQDTQNILAEHDSLPCPQETDSTVIIFEASSFELVEIDKGNRLLFSDLIAGLREQEILSAALLKERDDFRKVMYQVSGYSESETGLMSTSNPLDFLLNQLVINLDSYPTLKEAFDNLTVYARLQKEDCEYKFDGLKVKNTSSGQSFGVEIRINYLHEYEQIQLFVLMAEGENDLTDIEIRATSPFAVHLISSGNTFTLENLLEPEYRFAAINDDINNYSLSLMQDQDFGFGRIELQTKNTVCPDSGCVDPGQRRVPAKLQCIYDPVNRPDINLLDEILINSFSLGSNLRLKRAAIELDSQSGEASLFISQFNNAVYDSDGSTIIFEPTNCELYAIIDEKSVLQPAEEVNVEPYLDPTYDWREFLNSDGEPQSIKPTPHASYLSSFHKP